MKDAELLKKKQKQHRAELAAALLLLLTKKAAPLVMAKSLFTSLKRIAKSAQDVSGPPDLTAREKRANNILLLLAAMSLASQVARASVNKAPEQVLYENAWRVNRTADTTTFAAYNQSVLSQATNKVQWIAMLEKNTCHYCEELDGQVFLPEDVPDCPAHPSCACVLVELNA